MLEKESWNWNRRNQDEWTQKELTALVVPGISTLGLHSLLRVCYGQTCIRLSLKAHSWAIQNQANTEPQMPIWALKYVSTAVVVFQLSPLPIHIGYKCSFRSLLITVCGSPFPSLVTLVQTLCINLHSISDPLNFIRCSLDSISFERQRLILQADLASQSLSTAMMC